MRIAVTIGAYQLAEFVELGILAARHVFGQDVGLLVSDDISQRSAEILDVCTWHDVHHIAGGPRGHFAGDLAATVNALAFAENQKADLALKLSQRFMLTDPVARNILERHFSNPDVWLALPGRISARTIKRPESRFFANLSVLTDFIAIRTGSLTAQQLKDRYEVRVRNAQTYHDKLAESCFANLMDTHFAFHTNRIDEFTHPYPGRDPIYLRKCQSESGDYEKLALQLGMKPFTPILCEWRRLEATYRPAPTFV